MSNNDKNGLGAAIGEWMREFPRFPYEDMPAIPAGWRDLSWHNDVCPSFLAHVFPNGDILRVWVDWADPSKRELSVKRFSLIRADAELQPLNDGWPLCETDDWNALLAAVAIHKIGV
jgi:hypothetical protein